MSVAGVIADPTAILERAAASSRRLDGVAVPAAARHGDFFPQNILVSPDRVSVVDFERYAAGNCTAEDLGAFLAYLAMMEGNPLYSRRSVQTLARSFHSGYGDDGQPSGLVELYTARAVAGVASTMRLSSLFRRAFGGARRTRHHVQNVLIRLLGPR